MRTKTLWIKDEYFQQILSGRKTVEARVGYSNITERAYGCLARHLPAGEGIAGCGRVGD